MEGTMTRQSELRVETTKAQAATVVSASGVLDMGTIDQIETIISDAFTQEQDVVLDLSNVSMCDSAGLGAIVRMHRRAVAAGRSFHLRAPRPNVGDLLAMTGINKVVPVIAA
jgi:anti-sigma B factor antagonist